MVAGAAANGLWGELVKRAAMGVMAFQVGVKVFGQFIGSQCGDGKTVGLAGEKALVAGVVTVFLRVIRSVVGAAI